MWALFQSLRINAKKGITLFVWDWFLLVIVMMITAGYVKEVMHPAFPIIGLIWILATATAIWHLGGVEIDSLFFARLLGTEVGKEFTHALNIFFLLGSATVVFFSLFPVSKLWTVTIILPIALIGIFTSANLANKETSWIKFYTVYLWLVGIILFTLATVGVASWFKINIFGYTPEIIYIWFTGWVMRLMLLGLIFWVFSFIPKVPAKISGLLKTAGSLLIIAAVVLMVFPGLQAKLTDSGSFDKGKQVVAQHAAKATAAVATQLPANAKFVRPVNPGEVAELTCTSLELPPPERWTRGPNGVVREPDWPAGAKSRGLRNTTNDKIDLFVVLTGGQSLEPPAAEQKQVARAPVQ